MLRASRGALQPGALIELDDPGAHAIRMQGGQAVYAGTLTSVFQVALHEIGHALGLAHDTDPNSIMYPVLGPGNFGLDATDLAGAAALYRPEPATPAALPAAAGQVQEAAHAFALHASVWGAPHAHLPC